MKAFLISLFLLVLILLFSVCTDLYIFSCADGLLSALDAGASPKALEERFRACRPFISLSVPEDQLREISALLAELSEEEPTAALQLREALTRLRDQQQLSLLNIL